MMLMRLAYVLFTLMLVLFSSCRQNTVYSALIKQVKVCGQLEEGICTDDVNLFSAGTHTFYVSCILETAGQDAEVSFKWFFYGTNGQKELLETVVLKPRELSNHQSSTYVLVADLNRSSGYWPKGKYEVEVILDGTFPFSVIKTFKI